MSKISAGTTTTTSLVYTADTSGVLQLQTNGTTTAVTIDTAQNVGIGLTPSAFNGGWIQVKNGTGIVSNYSMNVGSNYYYDGTYNRYTNTAAASYYNQNAGNHIWWTAPSGTAGNPISGANAFVQAMTLDNGARLIVNGSSAGTNQNMLTLNGQASWSVGPSLGNANFYVIGYSSGTGVYVTNGGTSWTGTSDGTLKNVISTINSGLQTITALKPTIYSWKSDTENTPYAGFIAQEVQTVLPNIVDTDQHGKLGIRHSELIPYLVSAIQELSAKVTALEAKVA